MGDFVAIETFAIVDVVRQAEDVLAVIETIDDEFGGSFEPEINTIRGVLRAQRRTVHPEGGVLVLPCEVILAFRDEAAEDFWGYGLLLAGGQSQKSYYKEERFFHNDGISGYRDIDISR